MHEIAVQARTIPKDSPTNNKEINQQVDYTNEKITRLYS